MVKNPPANAGAVGSIPGLGRPHVLWSDSLWATTPTSLCTASNAQCSQNEHMNLSVTNHGILMSLGGEEAYMESKVSAGKKHRRNCWTSLRSHTSRALLRAVSPKQGPLPGHAHPSSGPSERQKAGCLFSGKYVLKEIWKKLSNYTGQIQLNI